MNAITPYSQLHTNHPDFRWEAVDDYFVSTNTGDAGELSRHTAFVHVPGGQTVCDGWGRTRRAPDGGGLYTLWMYTSNGSYEFSRWEMEAPCDD